MVDHISETPPGEALVKVPAPAPLLPRTAQSSGATLSYRDFRGLVVAALDELDQLGDRIAKAAGIR